MKKEKMMSVIRMHFRNHKQKEKKILECLVENTFLVAIIIFEELKIL